VAAGYVKVLEGEHSVLGATLISEGLQGRYGEPATGLPCAFRLHRYESHVHSVSGEDLDRLRDAISDRAATDPDLWTEHVRRCISKANQLTATARSLATLAAGAPSSAELAAGFTAFAEVSMEAVPFLVATPVVRAALESLVDRSIAEEAPDAGRGGAAQRLHRLLARAGDPDAVQETRDFYRLVLAVMQDDRAVDLLRNTSAMIAAGRIRSDYPEIHGRMRDHARSYGWLRARGWRSAPHTPKELVERMQAVVLRWTPETVREAAEPPPEPDPEAVLGWPPSEALARLTGSLQDLAALPCGRIGTHRRAASIAAPFLHRLAESMACSTEQLLFSSLEEIEGALAGRAPLPAAEAERRTRNSFIVERVLGDLQVRSLQAPPVAPEQTPDAGVLTGMTASRGRATGRVRVLLAAAQVPELGAGDVLVTATSTPDAIGGESVFPTRAGPPDGIAHAAAIVTDEGGFLSHAAILAREHGIPCVVGTERATSELVDGQVVEVDATAAIGRIIPLESS
jgi:phosphohistidine swiveling domain-containing protein